MPEYEKLVGVARGGKSEVGLVSSIDNQRREIAAFFL
jgi:hypothetical protein